MPILRLRLVPGLGLGGGGIEAVPSQALVLWVRLLRGLVGCNVWLKNSNVFFADSLGI